MVAGFLAAAIFLVDPGVAVVPVDQPPALEVDRCWRGWISTNTRPLATGHAEATRAAPISEPALIDMAMRCGPPVIDNAPTLW